MKKEKLPAEVEFEGEPVRKTSRRHFLAGIGIGATVLALAGQAFAFIRSLVPNVLYEPPQRFKAGLPDQFPQGVQFLADRRVFVFRDGKTFHAISAICTHLGCTVKIEQLQKAREVQYGGRTFQEMAEFHCPCHGSRYYGDGTNYAGPAPRPLDFLHMELAAEDGQLIVDTSKKVDRTFRLTV